MRARSDLLVLAAVFLARRVHACRVAVKTAVLVSRPLHGIVSQIMPNHVHDGPPSRPGLSNPSLEGQGIARTCLEFLRS